MASQPGTFNVQELSDAGVPLSGGRLYTYAYGTTTQKTAYTDAAGLVPHTYTADGAGGQYIALNSRGELPAPLYLAAGSYDLALKRADGSAVWTRRADGQANSTDLSATSGASLVGFIQAGTGAVARTAQDKMREAFSFKDFGAVGDGATDDSAAISACLAAAASAGVGVDMGEGTFLVGQLVIPATLKRLQGRGKNRSTLKFKRQAYAAAAHLIDLTSNTARCVLSDFAIDANDALFNATWTLYLAGSDYAEIANLSLTGSGAYGIICRGGVAPKVLNTEIAGTNGGYTVGVYGDAAVSTLRDMTVWLTRHSGIFTYGVDIGAGEGHTIAHCRGEANTGPGFMFALAGCSYSTITHCFSKDSSHEAFQLTDCFYSTISNCHGEWTTSGVDFGISINATATKARFNKVIGNTLINSFKAGLAAYDWSQQNLFAYNVLRDCGLRNGAGEAAMVCRTVTAGAALNSNRFVHNTVISETGTTTYGYLEANGGGGGSTLDLNVVEDNDIAGFTTNYSIVGANTLIFDKNWAAYTPTVAPTGGTGLTSTINSAFYRPRGKLIEIELDISTPAIGTGTGELTVSLPASFPAAANAGILQGREFGTSGLMIAGIASATGANVVTYANAFPVAAGSRFVLSGIYKAA